MRLSEQNHIAFGGQPREGEDGGGSRTGSATEFTRLLEELKQGLKPIPSERHVEEIPITSQLPYSGKADENYASEESEPATEEEKTRFSCEGDNEAEIKISVKSDSEGEHDEGNDDADVSRDSEGERDDGESSSYRMPTF